MLGQVSRRGFVKVGLALLGPIAVAGCGSQSPASPTSAAKPAQPAQPAPTLAPASQAPQGVSTGPSNLPKVSIWSGLVALTRASGSDAKKMDAVRRAIEADAKVSPYGIIPPPGNAGQEKLNLLLGSSGDQLDIFQGDWGQYQEAIIPINDLLDKYGPNVKKSGHPDWWARMTDLQGKIWGLPRLVPQLHTHPTWLRADWLKKANLPQPTTFADLETTIAEFRKIDANAVVLTSSLNDFRYATVGGFTTFGYSNWLDPNDNLLKPPELQPDFKDWVAKMADWYKKGWLYPQSFAAHNDQDIARQGHVGVFQGWYSRVTILFQEILSAVPGMDFELNDQGIKGPKGFLETFSQGGSTAIMITKRAKNPEACVQYWDWTCAKVENYTTEVYGIQGTDWTWADDKHFWVKRLNLDGTKGGYYAGELVGVNGPLVETGMAPEDPLLKRHYEYIIQEIEGPTVNYSKLPGKQTLDYTIPYDQTAIKKQVPGLADLSRLTDEETTKFITGVRSLSEWDAFLGQLKSAGLDAWMKAYTTQYLAFKNRPTPTPVG